MQFTFSYWNLTTQSTVLFMWWTDDDLVQLNTFGCNQDKHFLNLFITSIVNYELILLLGLRKKCGPFCIIEKLALSNVQKSEGGSICYHNFAILFMINLSSKGVRTEYTGSCIFIYQMLLFILKNENFKPWYSNLPSQSITFPVKRRSESKILIQNFPSFMKGFWSDIKKRMDTIDSHRHESRVSECNSIG